MARPVVARPHRNVGAFDALGSHARIEILDRLSIRTMTIADLVKELGLPRVTLRYHLTILAREGLIEEERSRGERNQIGRPPVRYRASSQARVEGYPRRRYELVGDIAIDALLKHLGEEKAREALEARGVELGRDLISTLAQGNGVTRWTPALYERLVLLGIFREDGHPVEVLSRTESALAFRAFNCPFLALAEKYPDLLCDALDSGFTKGQADALGGVKTDRLACMAHGSRYCEYEMRWPRRRTSKKAR